MFKITIALSAIALAALGMQETRRAPTLALKEETLILEWTASADEAVIKIEAESEEELKFLQVNNPNGQLVFELRARNTHIHALSGFVVEMQESTADELLEMYPEGQYQIRGRSADGKLALGNARLSHTLPLVPDIVYPYPEAYVPADGLILSWIPDDNVEGYVVSLEQNENDGLTVHLPAGSSQFSVPNGVLLPAVESQFELGAIGPNGNVTLVEVEFITLPTSFRSAK